VTAREDSAGDPDPNARLARIEQLITHLVQIAPDSDLGAADELVERLHRIGSPLARSIARVVELVAEQLIASGIALPPLAMACATLADGVRGKLTDRELEAARYEIETLLPVPDRPEHHRPVIAVPDVPLSALRKRSSE
jgi:hypothetical protein